MDPLLIICTLLGFTFEYSRRVYRTYHPRTEPARDFREFLPRRVSNWIDEVDWERGLGLRYDPWVPPEPSPVEAPPPADEVAEIEEKPVEERDEPSDLELTSRLESEIVRAVTQTVFDDLGLVEVAEEPEEELLPLENVVLVKESFATIDPLAGQPIGDPSLFMERTRTSAPICGAESVAVPGLVGRDSLSPQLSPSENIVSVKERAMAIDLLAGQPVGDPSVFMERTWTAPVTRVESVPVRTPVEREVIRPQFVARVLRSQEFGPVGAPGIFDYEPARAPVISITAIDFDGEQEYRVAASARKSDDYTIAAYTLNSGDKAPSEEGAEENDPPLDPVDELIAELLEEEPPQEDPNTLELPLEIPAMPNPFAHCEPVGGPDVFECLLPARLPAAADPEDLADEPSAPTTREVNRLSERVETILSNALARPAPAVNFGDLLAQIDARKKERRQKQQDAANRLPSQALEDNIERSANRDGGLKMTEYKVQFEIFEGPLDLLLYLVRKQEVDIYEVNLTQIAEEFIKYIELMRRFDLEVAGEFLVMASTLMYIKSKELLPVEQQSQMDDEDEDEDPRWELIRQLVEYKKFKDAASDFRQLELAQEDVFPRNPPKPDFPVQKIKGSVSVFDLLGAVNRILERIDSREEREIVADRWTVSEKIEQIHQEIQKRERFKFSELFEDALSRSEVVATFLALLELIKLKVIVVEQPDTYADIDICKAPPDHKLNLDAEEALPLEEAAGLPASEFDAPAGEED